MDLAKIPVRTPTTTLIPLGRLQGRSVEDVEGCLRFLRELYWPQLATVLSTQKATVAKSLTLPPKLALPARSVRHLIHDESVPDSGYASATEDVDGDGEELVSCGEDLEDETDEELEQLRSDTFEREFSIRWLTGFLARSELWAFVEDEGEAAQRFDLSEEASTLLSLFTCHNTQDDEDAQEDLAVIRKFNFANGVQVSLNDAPLSEHDHTSVGLQSWASAIVLAERICASPEVFFPHSPSSSTDCDDAAKGKERLRVLELGAGTGLLSIAAAKLQVAESILATDFHPDVLNNLRANVAANLQAPSPSRTGAANEITMPQVCKLDWENTDYTASLELATPFDVVLAADVIYHPEHAKWIRRVVEEVLARPSPPHPPSSYATGSAAQESDAGGVFWMAVALRMTGRHERMLHTVESVFPSAEDVRRQRSRRGGEGDKWQLAVVQKEDVPRMDGVGRADESGYKIFKIGWV